MTPSSVFAATGWKLLEKIGSKGIQIIVQIILARLLVPDDYGVVAILSVFISLSNVFIQNGFATSLIQKKEATQIDFCTAFFSSLGIALLAYIVLFVMAPVIASFYGMMDLTLCLRVQALVLFAASCAGVQQAYLSRSLNFRVNTIATLVASLLSGVFGVCFALRGWGVWALIFQQLISNYLAVAFVYLMADFRLRFFFSMESLRALFGYGWKILGSSLINTLYINMYDLVIGKVYTRELLGLYSRGQQFPTLLTQNLNDTVQSVTFPLLSQMQDDSVGMKRRMRRALTLDAFVVVPALLGLATISYEFVYVILGEKWIAAAPYMMLLSLVYSTHPIHTMNIQCMKALGRSDLFLKLEILKKVLEISVLLLTVPHGLMVMLWGQVALAVGGIPINVWPTKTIIGYGTMEQIRDLSPTLFAGAVMCITVRLMALLPVHMVLKLGLEVVVGALVYMGISYFLKNEAMMYLLERMGNRQKEDA